jgi:hypothetical protein
VKIDPECSSKTFIMYQTAWYPNPDHITNPHPCQHFKSSTKGYQDLYVHGYVTLGKLNNRGAVSFLQTHYFISCTFSTNCVHCISYFGPQAVETTVSTNRHFIAMIMYNKFQSSTIIVSQGNYISDGEIYSQYT